MTATGPGQESTVISNDRNCSIQTQKNTFYQTNIIWIEKLNEFPKITEGYHLSPIYQLQPFDINLKNKFKIGIRYDRDLAAHSNLGIYYYNQKRKKWVYTTTENNNKKQILTAELNKMDAVTIIQDLDSPLIRRTFPADGGRYNIEDVKKIKIIVDDLISGIDSDENSFDLLFNDLPVFYAYQPIKKEISYTFQKLLTEGQHKIDFKVRDRMGNESYETSYFVVY